MSKNISNLSGRIGLKDNLFKKMSENVLNNSPRDIKEIAIGRLQKLQNEYALKDNDTFALYHQMYWEEFIFNASKQFNFKITNKILVNLTNISFVILYLNCLPALWINSCQYI